MMGIVSRTGRILSSTAINQTRLASSTTTAAVNQPKLSPKAVLGAVAGVAFMAMVIANPKGSTAPVKQADKNAPPKPSKEELQRRHTSMLRRRTTVV